MTTRVFKYRQLNVKSNSTWTLTPTTGSEVATRVIINALHVKTEGAAQSRQWVNFWTHLYLLPSGVDVSSFSAHNRITVASFVYQSYSGNGNLLSLPNTITFRSSNSKSNSMVDNNHDAKFFLDGNADFLIGAPNLANRAVISGSGYLSSSVSLSGGFTCRWDIPEHFYMGPGDSLQISYGGYYSAASGYKEDTDLTYFKGADVDLVCIAEAN